MRSEPVVSSLRNAPHVGTSDKCTGCERHKCRRRPSSTLSSMTRLCWSRSNYCMPDAHNLFRIVSLPSNHARLNQEDLLRGSVRMALRAGCRSRGPPGRGREVVRCSLCLPLQHGSRSDGRNPHLFCRLPCPASHDHHRPLHTPTTPHTPHCHVQVVHSALSVDEVIARRRVVPLVTINHTKSGPARAVQP